jgi:hypothetical protein
MGYNTALDLTELDLEVALGYHLQGNHYPPVPLSMVQPCIEAIDAYYDEDYNKLIEMPEGVSYKGDSHAPAWARCVCYWKCQTRKLVGLPYPLKHY